MRTLSILERRSVGGGLSAAGIRAAAGGYSANATGEGGGVGGGALAGNVAGTLSYGGGAWSFAAPGLSVGVAGAAAALPYTLGLSTTGKLIDAHTGALAPLPSSCTVTTTNTATHVATRTGAGGGTVSVVNTDTDQILSQGLNNLINQTGMQYVPIWIPTIGSPWECTEMGGSDLAGGSICFSGIGNYGGAFGTGFDN